uniref:Tetratricopeptide repeat protein n=1 Tax=Roseihalotalea indica TaxID=2867963 RepID=A0AA49Q0J8_9BACT|nr:hypothetical protein K4G66_16055 [Tunicatimonas sp. TK19036]
MLRTTFIIFLSLLSLAGYSQGKLVEKEEVVFHSKFEEQAFKTLNEDNTESYFALLLAIDQAATQDFYQSKYALYLNILQSIQGGKFDKKSSEKKIKQLYKTLHQSFLRKYALKNTFSSIFRQGQYNCVSATALYAMALKELGIDYAIRETPTHVYLVAYPKAERILVESTDPAGGYYAFDDRFKSEFVTQMRKRKLISDQEFNTKGVNLLFDEYYFTDEDITLKELVGLQYYNDALYSMEDERQTYAQQQLEKAYLLYPSERIAYLLQGVTALNLGEIDLNSAQYGEYFVRMSRFRDYDITEEDLAQEFTRFTYEQLTQAYNVTHYDSMFRYITHHLTDSSLVGQISEIYYKEKGRIEYNKGNYSSALNLLKEACRLNPENVDNQSILVSAIAQKLNALSDNGKRIKLIEQYTNQFSFLENNNLVQGQLMQLYLIQFAQAYEQGNETEAKQARLQFEERMQQRTDDIPVNADLIGRAYSLAAVYYFKKGNERETKRLISKGLEYAPGNYELLQRKRMLGY